MSDPIARDYFYGVIVLASGIKCMRFYDEEKKVFVCHDTHNLLSGYERGAEVLAEWLCADGRTMKPDIVAVCVVLCDPQNI